MKVEETDEEFDARTLPILESIWNRLDAPKPVLPGTATTTCTLYRFFDADGGLLYIGISERGPERWRQHRNTKPWWTTVASASIEHYRTRRDGEEAERRAIASEHPLHNVIHNRS